MPKLHFKFPLPFTLAYFVAPVLNLFINSILDKSRPRMEWSATYDLLLFSISALALIVFYLLEKRLVRDFKAAELKPIKLSMFRRPSEETLFIIGMSYALTPATLGIILMVICLSVPNIDLYLLTIVTYIAMVVWVLRWLKLYSNEIK